MLLAVVALFGLTQFQSGPANYYGPRIDMRSPLSGSVLVAQALRSGRIRLPYVFRPQPGPFVLTCSPAPCTTPNVQASEGGSSVNETPIAANPMRPLQLLTGGNDYNCPSLQGFDASRNGGSTWNHTCMNLLAGANGDGDPILGYDTRNKAYIGGIDATSSSTSVIAFEKSANNGNTWSVPAVAVTGIAPYTFIDKPWMQVDDTPTSPRRDAIYISTTEFDFSTNNTLIAVAHSTNGGATWHNVAVDAVAFPMIDQFTDLGVGKDGALYLSWMRCMANGPTNDCGGTSAMLMFSKSLDGGVTWRIPKVMAMPNLAPDSCGAFYGCLPNTSERVSDIPAIDVDRSSGIFSNRLYAAFYNYTGNQLQVLVVRSKNGGSAWSVPVKVAPGAVNDEFFPWLTTGATGAVGVTWLDRRLDPANVNYDSFATDSINGGVTFAPNSRVSTVSSNPFNDGFGGGFMGDYTGNIWVGNFLFGSWTDTRSGIAQDEVGGFRAF